MQSITRRPMQNLKAIRQAKRREAVSRRIVPKQEEEEPMAKKRPPKNEETIPPPKPYLTHEEIAGCWHDEGFWQFNYPDPVERARAQVEFETHNMSAEEIIQYYAKNGTQ